jgi:hypothetical protein
MLHELQNIDAPMQPITEEQDRTLRNWASKFGEKPGQQGKAFLQTEKGISENQVDYWWSRYQGNDGIPIALVERQIINCYHSTPDKYSATHSAIKPRHN